VFAIEALGDDGESTVTWYTIGRAAARDDAPTQTAWRPETSWAPEVA
jgi:hypothetical protein